VDAAGVADPREAVQAVTDNGAGGMEIALRQGRDFGMAETLHAAQLQADWLALWCGFDRRHDRRLARRTAHAIESGWVQVNQGLGQLPGHSYGGYKERGIGREFSLEGMLDSFTQRKNVAVNLNTPRRA